MKVSTKGRYALRVMLDLAQHPADAYIPLKDIAQRQDVTVKYLEQIMGHLHKAGFVQSLRGNAGGYQLAKAPREYTAGDILRSVEGSLAPVTCLEASPNPCPRQGACPTLGFWKGLDAVIREYVDSVTLEELAEQGKESGYDFCI